MKDKWEDFKQGTWLLLNGKYNRFIVSFLLTLLVLWLLFIPLNFLLSPFVSFLELILFPVVLSAILYYIFDPLIDWLEFRRVSRSISIFVLFTVLCLIAVLISVKIFPIIVHQVGTFVKHLPSEIKELNDQIQNLLDAPVLHSFRDEVSQQFANLSSYVSKNSGQLGKFALHEVGGFVVHVKKVLLGLVLVPFLLFFLLKDKDKIMPAVVKNLPIKWRRETKNIGIEIHDKLSMYFRAQLIMAVGVTIILMIALTIAKVRYALTLSVITGILNFLVPSFGAMIGAVPALVVAAMDSPLQVLWVLIIYYVVQHTESHFVAPILLGNRLSVHPLTILVLLIWAEEMYGFSGLILVIPLYVIFKIVLMYAFEWYREVSEHY
jgi:predicted PurR-regulated permease PerM